jgi:hypothetical protein
VFLNKKWYWLESIVILFKACRTSGIFAILASILALCLPGLAAQAPQSKLDPKGLFAEWSMTYKEYH